jgi:NAD(P)-dependent dehydrogenase (short-subunit alcohol dehydrogenase family)
MTTDALRDRAFLVTGGGSGIGRATALAVCAAGGLVAVLDRSGEGVSETVALCSASAGATAGGSAGASPGASPAIGATVDVSDDAGVAAAVEQTVDAFRRLDGVVTCAGVFYGDDLNLLADVSLDTFMHVLTVNLAGTFLAIKHALPHLQRAAGAEHGAIVTIASTAAIRGHGYGSGYTASKGGVTALTRLIAVQYGRFGVRANCICPGGVDTPMAGGVWNTDEAREQTRSRVPLGKVADARDIADVAVFLLSGGARHVTGQTLTVDGGATVAG